MRHDLINKFCASLETLNNSLKYKNIKRPYASSPQPPSWFVRKIRQDEIAHRRITLCRECKHTTSIRLTRAIPRSKAISPFAEPLSDFSDNNLPTVPVSCIPERLDCPQAQSVPDNASRWKPCSGQAPASSDFPDDRMTDRFTKIWLTKQPFFCTDISRRKNQYGIPRGRRRSISVHRLFQFCTAPSGQDTAGSGEQKKPALQHTEIQIFSLFLSRRTPLRRDSGNFFA